MSECANRLKTTARSLGVVHVPKSNAPNLVKSTCRHAKPTFLHGVFKATVLFFINSTRIGCSSRRRRFIFSLRADQAGNNVLLYGVVDSTQQRVGARYDAEAGVRLPALDLVNPTSHNGWRADTLGEGREETAGEAALPARAHGG